MSLEQIRFNSLGTFLTKLSNVHKADYIHVIVDQNKNITISITMHFVKSMY